MTIRTACSASLIGLHEACRAILAGDCTAALVGGTNLIMAPGMTASMSEYDVLAPDGSCKSFSGDANGYARGEAISAVHIKPLADAIRDETPSALQSGPQRPTATGGRLEYPVLAWRATRL